MKTRKLAKEDAAFYSSATLLFRDGSALHAVTKEGEKVIFDLGRTDAWELLELGVQCAPKFAESLVSCLTPTRLRLLVERQTL